MFRKLVSYLAFSPSALWGLAKLNSSIQHETKKNVQIIWLAIVSLIVAWFSYFLTSSFPSTNTQPITTSPSKLDLSIERLGANDQPIEPSQLVEFKLTAKNNTHKTIDDILTTDISDISSILSFLPNKHIVVDNTSLSWSPGTIKAGESTEIIVETQSLNTSRFSINKPCSASVVFGNQLNLRTRCSPVSKLVNWISTLNKTTVIIIFTTVIIMSLISKFWRQLENYSKIIEIKALRNYINRGGPV